MRSLLLGRGSEVLNWLNLGKTSWDIQIILNRTERIVNNHVGNITQKLGVSNRVHSISEVVDGIGGGAD